MPMKYSKEFNEAELDPGIRDVVLLLRREGFRTTDSGDGVSKPADERTLDVPHVWCSVNQGDLFTEADRLGALLPEWHIEASYSPADGSCLLSATQPSPLLAEAAPTLSDEAICWCGHEMGEHHRPTVAYCPECVTCRATAYLTVEQWLSQQRASCQREVDNQHNDGVTRRLYAAREAAYQSVEEYLEHAATLPSPSLSAESSRLPAAPAPWTRAEVQQTIDRIEALIDGMLRLTPKQHPREVAPIGLLRDTITKLRYLAQTLPATVPAPAHAREQE